MKTAALLLTSRGIGAIAVLMVAGAEASRVIARLSLSPRAAGMRTGDVLHTELLDPTSTGEKPVILDHALVVRTGDERYELHLHGGTAVVEAMQAALQAIGIPTISMEEAEERGFLGKPGCLRTELLAALPQAQTITAVQLLAAQVEHGLTYWAKQWLEWLERTHGHTNAPKAAPAIWKLHSAAQWLSARSATLARLLDPPRIAIIGPPNAGKSTLANALLGRPMSITSEIAGTTRDWVDAQAIFVTPASNGSPIELPVILIDTAGIRDTADKLEQESIRRTHGQAGAADVIILLWDATSFPNTAQRNMIEEYADHAVIVGLNKVDLLPDPHLLAQYPHAVALSAKNHRGMDHLMRAVLGQLDLAMISEEEPFAFTQRQRDVLDELAFTSTPASAARLLRHLVDGHSLD